MTDQHRHQPQGDSLTGHRHDHIHGTLDSAFLSTQRGIWALKWSLWGLLATALFQLCIALISNSVALLADTIHNFGDAAIAIPLWIAFIFVHKKSTNRFTYGYGRLDGWKMQRESWSSWQSSSAESPSGTYPFCDSLLHTMLSICGR